MSIYIYTVYHATSHLPSYDIQVINHSLLVRGLPNFKDQPAEITTHPLLEVAISQLEAKESNESHAYIHFCHPWPAPTKTSFIPFYFDLPMKNHHFSWLNHCFSCLNHHFPTIFPWKNQVFAGHQLNRGGVTRRPPRSRYCTWPSAQSWAAAELDSQAKPRRWGKMPGMVGHLA